MKERIYLLETNVEEQNRSAYNPNSTYPLGLAYLDSTLTNEGYEVYTKDYADYTTEACLKEIERVVQSFNPNVIGISVMSMTRATTYKAIKLIKRINPASEEMFSLMEQAGFKEIRFGIETGSPKMLESIHKAITQEQIIRTFTIASKFKKIKFVKFFKRV